MASAQSSESPDAIQKRLNLMRYGMMVIPVVAWVIAFAYPFLVSNFFGMNWVQDALIPSLIVAAVVGVICFCVFWAYKRFVLKL